MENKESRNICKKGVIINKTEFSHVKKMLLNKENLCLFVYLY